MEKERPRSSFIKVASKSNARLPSANKSAAKTSQEKHPPSNEDIKQMLQHMEQIHRKIDKKLTEMTEIPELSNEKIVEKLVDMRKNDNSELHRMQKEQDMIVHRINDILSIPLSIPHSEMAAMQTKELAKVEQLMKEREELRKKFQEDLRTQKAAIIEASKQAKALEKPLAKPGTQKLKHKTAAKTDSQVAQDTHHTATPSPSGTPPKKVKPAPAAQEPPNKNLKGKTLGSRRGWIPMK